MRSKHIFSISIAALVSCLLLLMLCTCSDNTQSSSGGAEAGDTAGSDSASAANPQNKSDDPDNPSPTENALSPLDASEYSDTPGIKALKEVLQNDKEFYDSDRDAYVYFFQYIQSYDQFSLLADAIAVHRHSDFSGFHGFRNPSGIEKSVGGMNTSLPLWS